MINNYSGTEKDIHERIFNYVVIGLKVIKTIPKTPENLPIISQVSSSLTSIGANDQEADAAVTKRDFTSKYSIVRKETHETVYWWKVLKETGFTHKDLDWLIKEGREIFFVVSKIISNTKINIAN
ncbi:MAG: hypothetical protein UY21_C0009G0038 [Microgenomates group bacterium GW2011_GWA1_48_10]|nr:MAG: hypothetical protein UY21_C0009G0038 [Microgenomates group bacterium GW2011_GWA1_48_10]